MLTQDIHAERILIIDFGSQYTQLIGRRVREAGVYCEILPFDTDEDTLREFYPSGIILSGGPETASAAETPKAPSMVFEIGCPILGICYGMQTMATQLGGEVKSVEKREFGSAQIVLQNHSKLLDHIQDSLIDNQETLAVWMSHGDQVVKLPEGFQTVASTETCPIAVMANEERYLYGLQFHPEVTHTLQGKRILERFVCDICGCEPIWTADNIIADHVESVREQVGHEKVLLALSGGVDSSVVAVLLNQAIGQQLICVFVDTGLLRLNEADEVMATFAEHLGIQVIKVDARDRFFSELKGVEDPEQKRKICGRLFIEIFEEEAGKLTDIAWLAQGTIYPDVIESAGQGNAAHVIKSHHNVGGLPETMQLKLLEPLRELFKDEVRQIGLELGLPAEMLYRHPFPGPGLVVRILGEVKTEYAEILRQADHIFITELRKHQLYDKVSQAFAVFLPVRSVAVQGDARQHEFVIALRAVETMDFMTAHWAHLPYEFLNKVSSRICNEVPHVARVVYDVSDKPPATIEWE